MNRIEIPADAIRDLVHKAIIESLTPEVREKLLSDALSAITQPQKDYNGRPKESLLDEAFQSAVRSNVYQMVHKEMEDNAEWQGRIRSVVNEAFTRMTAGEAGEKLADKIADAMAAALRADRY